jgi:hypothetical protein
MTHFFLIYLLNLLNLFIYLFFFFFFLQNGVGGDHRTEDQRTHVRQLDDRRMRVGSAAWRFSVSL